MPREKIINSYEHIIIRYDINGYFVEYTALPQPIGGFGYSLVDALIDLVYNVVDHVILHADKIFGNNNNNEVDEE